MAALNLPTDVRTTVWATLKTALMADATLAASDLHLAFLDNSEDVQRDTESWAVQAGVVKFLPGLGLQAWFQEISTFGNLIVYVDALLPRADFEDQCNLQGALENAINTIGNVTLQSSLVTAGAVTGLVLWTNPLNQTRGREGAENLFRLTGQFVIEVERRLN